MIVDSHPPVPTSAVFDPATLMRTKANGQGAPMSMSNTQQQHARQRYWSGLTLHRPSSMQDATGGHAGPKNGKNAGPHQQWNTPAEKEVYTPFKSVSGRVTPLDDPYSPPSRFQGSGNEYHIPAPQDPRDRPPSRAMSVTGGMMGGGIYGRRPERKSEGSVVYQPLSPTNHAPAWSNSLMFNKPHGILDPFDQPDLPLGASAAMPPLPHIQTLPRQLPLARNVHGGSTPPDEPTHNSRQQVPQPQPFVTMNGYVPSDHHQMHKSMNDPKMGNGNRVTVVPNGTVIGSPPSLSSNDGDLSTGDQDDGEGQKGKKFNGRRRLGRQRAHLAPNSTLGQLPIVEKVAILHILLGATLFALGIARLVLMSAWGLGIELVYGIYVVLMGILGVIGCRRRHYCSVSASFVMSALSCILAIAPFVTGLSVTIPDSFRTVDPKYFISSTEVYGVDILLAVISLLELIMSIVTCSLGCSVAGRLLSKWRQMEQAEQVSNQHAIHGTNGKHHSNGNGNQQQPIFHTSVNITHPGMMK